MQKDFSPQTVGAFILGVLLGGMLASTVIVSNDHHNHHDNHQITQPHEEYHVHADFLIYINDELIDLSGDTFMTTSEQELHPEAHLHDNNGKVKHIHAQGITFVEFLESLGIILSDDCILLFDGNEYCSDGASELRLYVNNERFSEDIGSYIPVDDDRILVYYGDPESERIREYIDTVPADACYYSGTCPERGIAPPESCGLTCEL